MLYSAVKYPSARSLILTHIFFGPHGERIEIAEVVKHSAILFGLRGRFTKSICKMWVRISARSAGLRRPSRALHTSETSTWASSRP
jgi:hypothetical protein